MKKKHADEGSDRRADHGRATCANSLRTEDRGDQVNTKCQHGKDSGDDESWSSNEIVFIPPRNEEDPRKDERRAGKRRNDHSGEADEYTRNADGPDDYGS